MKDPAVSVILPVYDPGDGIRKCIEMLLTQTLSDIELIFIDDCGSDASMDVVREFAKSDARIRILINSENLGAGASRNRGIEAAKGEYVAFVDPDDYPQKDFLSLLYRKTVKTKPDIVKGDRRLVSFDGKQTKEGNRISLNDEIRAGLEKGGKIYQLFSYEHWTAIYRREFLIENHIRYGLMDLPEILKIPHFFSELEKQRKASFWRIGQFTAMYPERIQECTILPDPDWKMNWRHLETSWKK